MFGKVWVVVGVRQGVIETVRAFSNDGDAELALDEVDMELDIVRDEEGRYDSDNDAGLYEVEVEPPTL